MILRSPTENENRVIPSAPQAVIPRARGNPGLFRRFSLDTRFRGYDDTGQSAHFHPYTGIFERGHEGYKGENLK
jgi:hypothetical protein